MLEKAAKHVHPPVQAPCRQTVTEAPNWRGTNSGRTRESALHGERAHAGR
jgi:hypothetical protein